MPAHTALKLLLLSAIVWGCTNANKNKSLLPSKIYRYVQVDTANLSNKHAVYAPVYSHLYGEDGNTILNLSATLSIRNISFTDSFYVTNVVYYGSHGEVLRRYLDSTIEIKPMSSVEFVVERSESKGGAGANFVVNWASAAPLINEPLIQTVMSVTNAGVSFVTTGVEIRKDSSAGAPKQPIMQP